MKAQVLEPEGEEVRHREAVKDEITGEPGRRSTKHQFPNSKQIPMFKIWISKRWKCSDLRKDEEGGGEAGDGQSIAKAGKCEKIPSKKDREYEERGLVKVGEETDEEAPEECCA